jgi:ferredoxin
VDPHSQRSFSVPTGVTPPSLGVSGKECPPDAFRMDEDDLAECYDPEGASKEDIKSEAIDVCPSKCIH